MKHAHLMVVTPDTDLSALAGVGSLGSEALLLHLRITGRHGVFLLQQGATAAEAAVVDTRTPAGVRCTCADGADGGECEHVVLLRACGFLPKAA